MVKPLMTYKKIWQAMRDSNPQPSVLETDALPIEPIAFNLLRMGIIPIFLGNASIH